MIVQFLHNIYISGFEIICNVDFFVKVDILQFSSVFLSSHFGSQWKDVSYKILLDGVNWDG